MGMYFTGFSAEVCGRDHLCFVLSDERPLKQVLIEYSNDDYLQYTAVALGALQASASIIRGLLHPHRSLRDGKDLIESEVSSPFFSAVLFC
ncbi:hypothetical protein Tco_0066384 [Tanacetum coccineum]